MYKNSQTSKKVDILIVDDIPEKLKLLSKMLMSQGYAVRKAINASRAWLQAKYQRPNLIYMDL